MTSLERAVRLVRSVAALVPRWRRHEWVREWTAELTAADREHPGSAPPRATGAIRDALSLRSQSLHLDLWWNDLTLALRTLRRRPGFAGLVVLTLALGLGVNGAVFALVDAVLLRPLPYPDAERLVVLHATLHLNELRDVDATPFDYAEWHRARSFDALAMVAPGAFTISGDSEPEQLRGARVTASTLPMLGLLPAIGRTFTAAEDRDAVAPVVILGDAIWRRRFGADGAIVGRAVRIDGTPHTVVGIMRPGAALPGPLAADDQIWLPARMSDRERTNPISHNYTVLARLAPGVPLAAAAAEMTTIAAQIAKQYPDTHGILGAHVVPAVEETVGHIRPALFVLVAAVALLVFVACANVATLLIARAMSRRGEMAVRTALGAPASRLLSITTAETVVLSAVGGIVAVAIGDLLLDRLVPLFAGSLPRAAAVRLDARAAVWTMAVAVIAGVALGGVVILQQPFGRPLDALKAAGRSGAAPLSSRMRHLLVTVQVAFSVVLLASAGLMLRSYSHLSHVQPGFSPERVLTFHIALPETAYRSAARRAAFVSSLLDRLAALPGANAVGVNSRLPFTGNRGANEIEVEGQTFTAATVPIVDQREVSPGYFGAMGVPILAGRAFTPRDDARAEPVAIVNQTMARRFWPGDDAVGQRVKVGSGAEASGWLRIVGIAGDVRHSGLSRPAPAEMYRPYAQMPMTDFFLVARTAGDPDGLVADARAAVRALDGDLPIYDVRTMDERIARSVADTRATALLLLVMAVLAGSLAAVGIYGSIWYGVSQRLPEIGIRIALGAPRASVCASVLGRALAMTATGAVAGLAIALAAAPLLRRVLFDTRPAEPTVYAAVGGAIAVVAAAASILPALRAMRVDPVEALRRE